MYLIYNDIIILQYISGNSLLFIYYNTTKYKLILTEYKHS
jgi:hypothetical protein